MTYVGTEAEMTEDRNSAQRRLRRAASRGGGRVRLVRRLPVVRQEPDGPANPAGPPPGPATQPAAPGASQRSYPPQPPGPSTLQPPGQPHTPQPPGRPHPTQPPGRPGTPQPLYPPRAPYAVQPRYAATHPVGPPVPAVAHQWPAPSARPGPAALGGGSWPGGDWWPGLPGAASPLVLGAVAAAGLVGAASLPLQRPGAGWLVTGLTAASGVLAVVAAGRRTPLAQGGTSAGAASGPAEGGASADTAPAPAKGRTSAGAAPAGAGTRAVRAAWAVAAFALLAVGAVRAAGWLFLLCLPAAAVAAALALVGGRTVRQIALGVVLPPLATLRGLPWAARGVAALRSRGSGDPVRIAVAALVTLGLLGVFGALFSSADAAFARLLGNVLPDFDAGRAFRWVFLFALAGAATLGAVYLVLSSPRWDDRPAPARSGVRRLEWALPLGALTALFATFVLVQLTVLFGGSRHVLRTADLTYAEYARRGFWQLLVVTLLTLAVLAAAARWAPRDTAVDRAWFRGLLGALALLTLVIVASALYRMHVYEEAYGFTRLRVLVSAVELALGAVFVMVLVALAQLRGGWLPQAVVATAVVALLGLAALNPDQFIADRNIDRYRQSGRIDTVYLSRLSADAVPALDRLGGRQRTCTLQSIETELAAERDAWGEWNLGRTLARRVLAARPSGSVCWLD